MIQMLEIFRTKLYKTIRPYLKIHIGNVVV